MWLADLKDICKEIESRGGKYSVKTLLYKQVILYLTERRKSLQKREIFHVQLKNFDHTKMSLAGGVFDILRTTHSSLYSGHTSHAYSELYLVYNAVFLAQGYSN